MTDATTALETSNRNYERLIHIVAHDLRNPIGAISMIAGMKINDQGLPFKEKEWIRLIDDAGRKCLQLITELLEADFSVRQENLVKEPTDLTDLLHQTMAMLAHRVNEKGQRLVAADIGSPMVKVDKEKIGRVLDNLITNAVKFSPTSAVIEIRTVATANEVIISVQDNGIGIPQEMGLLLFEPFVKSVRRKGTAGEQSFGLGLYICRQIIEAHGGRIWFESEEGKGTTFYVGLPYSSCR